MRHTAASSGSTLPLSESPPLILARSPFARVPLPPQIHDGQTVSVNPILQPNSSSPRYDLSKPPASNTLMRSHATTLLEHATSPPLPSLTLTCPLLPWAITVHSTNASGFVTVVEVFNRIYEELRQPVAEDEFNALSPSYTTREAGNWPSEWNRRRAYRIGTRRIHFLRGRTLFRGLSQSNMGPDTWALNVE